MPTRKQFDMVVITVLLLHPVLGLAKVWAARKQADQNSGSAAKVVAGAVNIVA